MTNRFSLLITASFIFVTSSTVYAGDYCAAMFKPKKTDLEIIRLIDRGRTQRAGEQNFTLMKYLENNVAVLTPTGAVTLIRALRSTSSQLSRGSRQFYVEIPERYARERMVHTYLEVHRESLGKKGVIFFQDLL